LALLGKQIQKSSSSLGGGISQLQGCLKKGIFMVDINFRNLKTNTVDPDKAATRANPIKELNCRVMPPKDQEGLIFSIPHRLLTIALRRDLLLDIASLNALIDGDKYNIMVRKSTTSVLPY
jgi:hypothetical protein